MISRLNEIFFFYFFSNSFCFNFFSGKYWKRNVPSGVPYFCTPLFCHFAKRISKNQFETFTQGCTRTYVSLLKIADVQSRPSELIYFPGMYKKMK